MNPENSKQNQTSPGANSTSKSEPVNSGLSYRGSVAGLKGLLSGRIGQGIASGLANALSSLDKVAELARKTDQGTQPIPIEQIHPCADQPRQIFEPRALEELAQTMRELGQAQAITVRRTSRGFEIVSGERRYRAAKLAGFTQLDCVIKDCNAHEARLLALVENTQRQDLLPIEEAFFLKKVLHENSSISLEKLAKMLGTHKSTLSEKIQLAEVPEDLQPMLYARGRTFTHRHWRVISRIKDAALLRNILLQALEHQMSVAELERSLAAYGIPKAPRRAPRIPNLQLPLDDFSFVRKVGNTLKVRAINIQMDQLSEQSREQLIAELEDVVSALRL